MCQCGGGGTGRRGGWGGEKGYYSCFPPGHFPGGRRRRRRRTCEVNTDAVYFPALCKPAVAPHKVKVKEPNLLYWFTQLSAAIPHIWRLPVSDTEICHSRRVPHGVLYCIFKFQRNMKVDYDKWAGMARDISSSLTLGNMNLYSLFESSDVMHKADWYQKKERKDILSQSFSGLSLQMRDKNETLHF